MTRKKRKKETVVYFGPTVPGTLQQFAVFVNGLPKETQKKVDENPILKHLFTPISGLAEVRNNLKAKGSREQNLYKKALEKLGGIKR